VVATRQPTWTLPARRTVCDLLDRAGLITASTRHGVYCYPLTIADGFSRYLLACHGLLSTAIAGARPSSSACSRSTGCPASSGPHHGARAIVDAVCVVDPARYPPELIAPASPQQNGRHERMHRTLKAEATRPPSGSLHAQQVRFNRFRQEYNHDRPHEALGQETPASHYQPPPRELARRLPPLHYPGHVGVRLVSRNSGIRWKKRWGLRDAHARGRIRRPRRKSAMGSGTYTSVRSNWADWTSGASR
jgi:putative transposase